jgi:competence protein ComEC
MKLLYLAVAYLAGLGAGQLLWQQGWFGCGIDDYFWIAALALIPVCLWMDVRDVPRGSEPMVWPASAGFVRPRTSPSIWLIGGIFLAGICGVLRLGSHPPQPCLKATDLAYYNGSEGDSSSPLVTVDGYVVSYPVLKDGRRRLDIEAAYLEFDGERKRVTGRLRLQTGGVYRFRYGESVRVSGQLTEPPIFEDFDYRAYLARKQIHSLMRRARVEPQPGMLRGGFLLQFVYGLRDRGERLLNRLLPEPYAALANGMLLGIEAGIPDELYEKFNLTGTSHVIVISGSNVALVTGVLMALGIRLFGRRGALWPTLGGLALYTFLVGGDAAVMRAALMGGLFVVATVLGRQSTALVSLGAACWAMTLWNPLMMWDVGFQLSSAATVGLILIGPAITDSFTSFWRKLKNGLRRRGPVSDGPQVDFLIPRSIGDLLRDGLLMTIAASVTTLPLIVHYFGRLSLISLLTNLLIAPVQPWIMIFGGMGLIVGLLGLDLIAQYLLFVPYGSLWWTTTIVNWNAAFQGGSVEVDGYGGGPMALTYAAILGLYWRKPLVGFLSRVGNRAVRFSTAENRVSSTDWQLANLLGAIPAWMFGILAIVAGLLWWLALTQPDGQLHVHFLDVGQGDGIFIQTPSGRQVLIDGGDDSQQLFAELGAVMPFWDRQIDQAIVTHPDWDHIGGQVDLPGRFTLGQAIISENVRVHEDTQLWLAALEAENVPVVGLQQGAWLDLGDGVALWALWPPREEELRGLEEDDKNERSLVLKLVYGEFSVLLTGDAGLPSEETLLREGQPIAAHVLKVGHHGSEHSSSPAFVEAVSPSVAIIQVGAENRYGHPDPEVLEILGGRLVLRNDREGRVHIWSDGRLMWIGTEKGDGTELLEWGDAARQG